MKKDNKLPLSVIAKSVTIIVEGKKPLAQQLNNVAVQRNYSKKAVGYSRNRKPSVHRQTVKARQGRAVTEYRKAWKIIVLPDGGKNEKTV